MGSLQSLEESSGFVARHPPAVVSAATNDGAGLTMAGTLRICLLGDAGVWLGEQRLVFLTHRAELAVFCLALAGPAGLHRDVLVERLWPDTPADKGRQRLRTLLWQARMALGPEAWRLARRTRTIRLDVDGVVVDLRDVRGRSDALLRSPSVDIAEFRAVLAALAQPILVGWQFEPWVEAEQERNAELVLELKRRMAYGR